MFRSLALLTGLSLAFAIAGCAASDSPDETGDDDVVSGGPGAKCTQTIDAKNNHVAEIEAKDGKLTIKQSSLNGRFAPLSYGMSRVMLMTAPSGKPKFECNSGASTIMVWDKIARVGAAYYQLSASEPASQALECSKVLDAESNHTMTMKFAGDQLTVTQTAINARFAPESYSLSRVMLAVAPAGEPKYDCSKPGADMTLWSDFARVNGAYYKTAPR